MDVRELVTPPVDFLALGEPAHLEPAIARIRNDLFAQLAGLGFTSIALETDRVRALAVNDFVQRGTGTLDAVMREGFSHRFGELDTNRELVAWMREYNEGRPAAQRLAFHGFDTSSETMEAPSPRAYLEHARDYLGLDHDVAALAGDDERWNRTEAIMDPAQSPGATPEAARLRAIADDMLTALYADAPALIAKTSRDAWFRAKAHLTAGLGLLRHHRQAAERTDQSTRWNRMCAFRDAMMARNLLDVREADSGRGPTFVFASNRHLQRNRSHMRMGPMEMDWAGAGSIVSALVGDRYRLIVGSLGSSKAIELGEPRPETFEGLLQRRVGTWDLIAASDVVPGETRTDTDPMQGYFPLDQETVDGADAVLHVRAGTDMQALSLRQRGAMRSEPSMRMTSPFR
ncbi:erythromycin esterase family protein [Amycolatopsis thermophila]|uniref:Erythromycin esterase-like protein n=1 Tax=Amycolatopsis thermophila TaxID=206084 RepID=A0ABU0ES38_9PSEU|nr:erythromycin esterase family protein [Amycolatopsis thermophila]MDQ0378106.1 erythromycin esterase-like protein [Amycolatopsis thermophila]